MRPTHAVARTDEQQTWPATLRISEVAPPRLKYSGKSQAITCSDVVRTGSMYLQEAWRWLERRRAQQLSSRRLRLAETISLGEKRSVSIVQVDGAQFLIGCSAGSVQLLAVLDKQSGGVKPLGDASGTERAV